MGYYKFGNTLGIFVKKFRDEYKLSQEELGKRMGIHGQYVSNVEREAYDAPAISFCALFLDVVDRKRKPYLIDLIQEISADQALRRMQGRKERLHGTRKKRQKR